MARDISLHDFRDVQIFRSEMFCMMATFVNFFCFIPFFFLVVSFFSGSTDNLFSLAGDVSDHLFGFAFGFVLVLLETQHSFSLSVLCPSSRPLACRSIFPLGGLAGAVAGCRQCVFRLCITTISDRDDEMLALWCVACMWCRHLVTQDRLRALFFPFLFSFSCLPFF